MKNWQILSVSVAIAIISACATAPSNNTHSGYKSRLTNDGLVPLTGSEIETLFRGKNFRTPDGGWTWDFKSDGLADAKARDGSWQTIDQRWSVEGDKLCRSLKEKYPCVSIYQADEVIRFGKVDSNKLETWVIVPK